MLHIIILFRMGNCLSNETRFSVKTEIGGILAEKGIITFTVNKEQHDPKRIQSVVIVTVEPHYMILFGVKEIHAGRVISLNLWAMANDEGKELPVSKPIQFRISFKYPSFRSNPTDVIKTIFTPVCNLERHLRLSTKWAEKEAEKTKNQLVGYSNSLISYYKHDKKCINIMMMGSHGVGKSSFILSVSRLLHSTPLKPQIGNKMEMGQSTTRSNESYEIVMANQIQINLIDSPGWKSSTNFIKVGDKLIESGQQFWKTIHTGIVLINPFDKESLAVGMETIKCLSRCQIEYVTAIIGWEKETQLYSDYYAMKVHQRIKDILKREINLIPIQNRLIPISNIKCQDGDPFAQIGILECFSTAIQLGANFYQQHVALHCLLDGKLVDIRHRIDKHMKINDLVKQLRLAELVFELSGKDLNRIYIERAYGRKGERGLAKIENELLGDTFREVSEFTVLINRKYLAIKLFTDVPLFSTLIQ